MIKEDPNFKDLSAKRLIFTTHGMSVVALSVAVYLCQIDNIFFERYVLNAMLDISYKSTHLGIHMYSVEVYSVHAESLNNDFLNRSL